MHMQIRFLTTSMIRAVVALGLSGPVMAQSVDWGPLRANQQLTDGWVVISVGNDIRQACDRISARLLRAFSYPPALETMATQLGYTRAQIEEFVDDRAEKDRVDALALTYLTVRGVTPSDPESYCTVGRDEINADSEIGRLLRGG